MELTSKYYSYDFTIGELIKEIPDSIWQKIENKFLARINEDAGERFTHIDFIDSEGRLNFGASN